MILIMFMTHSLILHPQLSEIIWDDDAMMPDLMQKITDIFIINILSCIAICQHVSYVLLVASQQDSQARRLEAHHRRHGWFTKVTGLSWRPGKIKHVLCMGTLILLNMMVIMMVIIKIITSDTYEAGIPK